MKLLMSLKSPITYYLLPITSRSVEYFNVHKKEPNEKIEAEQ